MTREDFADREARICRIFQTTDMPLSDIAKRFRVSKRNIEYVIAKKFTLEERAERNKCAGLPINQ